MTGIGVKKDESEGTMWIRKAADIGNPFAFAFMVYISHDETWLQRCFQTCNAQKDSNDPAIQFLLGLCYCGGEGVKQDETEGIKWIRKSADQGYAKAQFRLGQYYEFDKKDAVEAIKWYLKAAKQGDVQAQHHLADCYADGTGVEKDMTEAVKWGRKCAEQGMAKAQRELGLSYEHGEGVEKNIAEAIKWYRKAAEQGDAYAQRALERLEK